MRVAVLGAGVVGITAAYYLQRHGHAVTIVDRQALPASETSSANGGQISVSHAEPWATPRTLRKLPAWLLRRDAPLRLRLQGDPQFWSWCVQFLRECQPQRTRHNIGQLVSLGLYSRRALQVLRAEIGLEYGQRTRGILHLYTDAEEFAAATVAAAQMRDYGCERRVVSADEAVAIEPALRTSRAHLVGGTYTADDESGNAQTFTRALAERVQRLGAEMLMAHRVIGLHTDGQRIAHVTLADAQGQAQQLQADAYVLALGSESPLLVRALGLRLMVQPAKGYSLTMPVRDPERAYEVSLTDDEHKLVFSRLGDRLRIAGMAELRGYDRELDPARCALLMRRTEFLFPGAGDATQASYWTGLRPSTPSNVPYIGRTRYPNLFLNTGHGTLGWTHACGSGLALADLLSGRTPELDFEFTDSRF